MIGTIARSISRINGKISNVPAVTRSVTNSTRSPQPLMEHFRSTWPEPPRMTKEEEKKFIPPRTVAESALRFEMTSSFHHGTALYYPHLQYNPADFKVKLMVSIADLNLSPEETKIFIEMVGPRYNVGKREVRLISDRFPNRLENRKYVVLLLENLLLETKRIFSIASEYQ